MCVQLPIRFPDTQKNMCHNDKQQNRVPTQQSQGTDARTDMSESKQDCVSGSDTSKSNVMKSSQDDRNGEVRIRSGR